MTVLGIRVSEVTVLASSDNKHPKQCSGSRARHYVTTQFLDRVRFIMIEYPDLESLQPILDLHNVRLPTIRRHQDAPSKTKRFSSVLIPPTFTDILQIRHKTTHWSQQLQFLSQRTSQPRKAQQHVSPFTLNYTVSKRSGFTLNATTTRMKATSVTMKSRNRCIWT